MNLPYQTLTITARHSAAVCAMICSDSPVVVAAEPESHASILPAWLPTNHASYERGTTPNLSTWSET